jgi:nucleotide-binding universal stress UspA family protein
VEESVIRNILVTVDGSDASARAVGVASELAARLEATLLVLHVIRDMALPKELSDMLKAEEATGSRLEILRDSARIILERAGKQAAEAGVKRVETEFLQGDPANTIMAFANEHQADIIVMGTRGLGQVESMLLGSVSRKVSNLSRISCLIVP